MDDNNYDEFGNYIGELASDEEAEEDDAWVDNLKEREEDTGMDVDQDQTKAPQENLQRAVILHEDKKYYPDASEVFGDAEVTVQDEDTQPITEPIIKPITHKVFEHTFQTKGFPPSEYTKEFHEGLMTAPALIRNVALVGQIHHGKTILMDMLLQETHASRVNVQKNERFTDMRFDEQERHLTMKSKPLSLVLPNTKSKSYLVNIFDTPGHVNLSDEVTAAIRLCDGVVVVVDAAEGVMVGTEKLIRHCIQEKMAITLVINKVDRLILELKLPPNDAFFKLRHTIDEVNDIIESSTFEGTAKVLSPELGNVVFASGEMAWSFSLRQFAQIYAELHNATSMNIDAFAKKLWGDLFFDPATRQFTKTQPNSDSSRSFVHFVLEPLYKIYTQALGESSDVLRKTLTQLGVSLTKEEYDLDVKPLLKTILPRFFGGATGFVDMLAEHIPSPEANARTKVEQIYTGPLDSKIAQGMLRCDPKGPLMVHVSKLYPNESNQRFFALGRVMSGTLKLGERVRVLAETYSTENDEDMAMEDVTGLYIYNSRYKVEISIAGAGNFVLIEGVDQTITKTATITTRVGITDELFVFKPLRFNTKPIMKIAIEPLNPAELPKMLDGLRKCNKTYPLLVTKKEESGEHIVLGAGELYLDSVMHDMRKLFTEIEIKVSDPVVTFCETVLETSSVKCFAETTNKRNKLTVIAEPLEKGLADDIEAEKVSLDWDKKKVTQWFSANYDWDMLAARNIWAFGPEKSNGPNILLNDSLPTEVDPKALNHIKDFVVQGFQWATREGPLAEEPIRNVKFKLLHATVADEPIHRSGTQLIPAARRVAYSAFLTATPRLMEPVYFIEILTPSDCISAIFTVLARRRGHVTEDKPKAGTPLYTVKAYLPVIDSFGFETDLRTHTRGQAFCLSVFDHWAVVPGDPLDKTIVLRPLEPAPVGALARDFMLKTRRRKGLSEDVSVDKFFDPELLEVLANMPFDNVFGGR